MDPVTHGLTGFALARAGLSRLTPRAAWITVLGAIAPDIDRIAPFEWQRSVTHSWIISPILAAVVVVLVRFGGRSPVRWVGAWVAAFVGIASHIFLDEITLPGVSWLWPVSNRLYHLDLIAPGDLWVGIILLIAVVAPFLSRMVSSEIGAQKSSGRGAAIFALILVCIYIGARQQLHLRAEAVLNSRIYNQQQPKRISAEPLPNNFLEWRGLVETDKFLRVVPVRILHEFDPDEGPVFYPPESSPALEMARNSEQFAKLRRLFDWPRWEVVPFGDTVKVSLVDLRTQLGLNWTLDPQGRILEYKLVTSPEH